MMAKKVEMNVLADGRFVADGVELAHHLRQSPGSQGGQHDDTQQVDGLRPQERDERAVQRRCGLGRNLRQTLHRRGESPISVEYGRNDGTDTYQHDQPLDEVVHGSCHVAAYHDINTGEDGHAQHAPDIIHVESHAEKPGQAVIEGSRIRDEEDEHNDGRGDFQRVAEETLPEEVRHGGALQMLCHQACPATQDPPGQERADERIAQADPGGGQAILPAELAGVADEDDRRKVRRTECECRKPGADIAASQDKTLHI